MIRQYINGMADSKYFTKFFPGRKVKLRKTQRFGEAIYKFSQIIRRGIMIVKRKNIHEESRICKKLIYHSKKFLLKI